MAVRLPMIKKILFALIFFSFCYSFCQKERKFVSGKIVADSLSIENIHIINKSSGVATLSNKFGEFRIPIRENDSLLFSSIQFVNRKIIIQKDVLNQAIWIVKLKIDINQLDEVIVNNHNLTGSLLIDANNLKDSINTKIEDVLSFDSSEIISDFDKTKTYFPEYSADPIPQKVGINFAQLVRLAIKKIKKKDKKSTVSLTKKTSILRKNLGDDFFTKTLKLKKSLIDPFIERCEKKGVFNLYAKNRKLEMIDLMINESKVFLLDLKNEKK